MQHMTSTGLYLRLLHYVKPYWRVFALSVLGMVIVAITEPALPALMKPLLDGTFVHKDDHEAEIETFREARRLSDTLGIGDGLDVLGPTPAFLHRLRGEYRWQITVRGTDIERAFPHLPRARGWSIDVDPGA